MYTVHSALCTVHSTQYTVHSELSLSTSGDEKHDDPSKTGQEGQPVQNEEPSWRI